MRHELERAGQAIGAMDLLIAANALALAATLVTNNLAHFQRISGHSVTRWP
jgi:tRNA(fMet)-specific endonuclease VapC